MKRAIATRADENIRAITDISFPVMEEYAAKCEADLLVLGNDYSCEDELGTRHYRIFEIRELLQSYDEVASMDCDILIAPHCPNIFELAPGKITTIFEDKGTRQDDRQKRIQAVQDAWGDVGWEEGYINTGVFVVSRKHADIFRRCRSQVWLSNGYDDVHLGYMIHAQKHEVHEIPFTFNHMSMFSESWNGNADRLNSYIIHYAGGGRFPGTFWSGKSSAEHVVALMKKDKEQLDERKQRAV